MKILPSPDPGCNRSSGVNARAVEAALRYIESHPPGPLSLRTVARGVRVAPQYLSSLFTRHTGTTLTEHLARLRVRRAKRCLGDPSLRINEAAFRSGFNSLSQFNRVFRRITGVSPTVYRSGLELAAGSSS